MYICHREVCWHLLSLYHPVLIPFLAHSPSPAGSARIFVMRCNHNVVLLCFIGAVRAAWIRDRTASEDIVLEAFRVWRDVTVMTVSLCLFILACNSLTKIFHRNSMILPAWPSNTLCQCHALDHTSAHRPCLLMGERLRKMASIGCPRSRARRNSRR